MTGGSQILRNINGFMVLRYKQPAGKTVPYGNTLQFPICWSMKSILEIWSRENTAVFHIRQSKTAPGRKRNGTGVEGTHEPIIDHELWDRVQSMVAEKAKPFTAGTIGLFSRKARCMN